MKGRENKYQIKCEELIRGENINRSGTKKYIIANTHSSHSLRVMHSLGHSILKLVLAEEQKIQSRGMRSAESWQSFGESRTGLCRLKIGQLRMGVSKIVED